MSQVQFNCASSPRIGWLGRGSEGQNTALARLDVPSTVLEN